MQCQPKQCTDKFLIVSSSDCRNMYCTASLFSIATIYSDIETTLIYQEAFESVHAFMNFIEDHIEYMGSVRNV